MNVAELLQQLDVGATIELFSISTVPIGGSDVFNFHAGTNKLNGDLVWQGVTYPMFPIMAEGFDKTLKGTLPRPRMKVANVTGIMSAVVRDFDDLVGASVTRKRTFARYLDSVNFLTTNPNADPTQYLPDDVYFIEKKISENKVEVHFELASALDLAGVQLPSREINANVCSSAYRGPECGYTGTNYFDANNDPVGSLALDVCSKSVTGCKRRFAASGVIPFGGFPAARTYKY